MRLACLRLLWYRLVIQKSLESLAFASVLYIRVIAIELPVGLHAHGPFSPLAVETVLIQRQESTSLISFRSDLSEVSQNS